MNQEFMGSLRKSRREKKKQPSTKNSIRHRRILFETLEDRRVMAGVIAPTCNPIAAITGDFWPGVSAADFRNCGTVPANSAASAEGSYSVPTVVSEVEPNDTIASAQPLPLGFTAPLDVAVDVTGSIQGTDIETFRVSLKGGDVFSAKVTGARDLSLQNSSGTELIGSDFDMNSNYSTTSSPFPKGGNVSLSVVIPQDGEYYLQVQAAMSGSSVYRLNTRVYRSPLEKEAIGTRQILFLDFNGAILDTSIFGSSGIARLSPLKSFLPGWGLGPENENEVIDAIVARVKHNIEVAASTRGNNGSYALNGTPGAFDIEVRNSRDHADPWGLPNVSRAIISGSSLEFGILGLFGIAESVDVGNFDTTETSVTLLDAFSGPAASPASINSVRLAPGASKIELIGRLVGDTASHEAGHFFGNVHTDPNNTERNLEDTGGGLTTATMSARAGVGPDNLYGTADDLVERAFGVDAYDPVAAAAGFGPTGIQDTLNNLAWSLPTGKVATSINGVVFNDRNGNGVRDTNDQGLPGWRVFDDVNGNGIVDGREANTLTDADGKYTLYVSAGAHTIAQIQQPTWTQSFPTTNVNPVGVKTNKVNVLFGQSANNVNFGNSPSANTITGVKWHDVNADGVRDAAENGLAGFTFYVDLDNDSRLDVGEPAAVSDATGYFKITTAEVGTYTVRELARNGWDQTSPANKAGYSVTLAGGSTITGRDFGNAGPNLDFGDAPAPYPTLLVNDGARAYLVSGFHLGPATTLTTNPGVGVDKETDGQPSAAANGDDTGNTDDEDGITLPSLVVGQSPILTAVVTAATGQSPGYLQGWIDFNADGDWKDPGEQIFKDRYLGNGTHQLQFTIPATASAGTTFARFRWGYETGIGPTGLSNGGEVEDYTVTLLTNQPRANDDTFTVDQNSTNNSLDVLANDIASSSGALSIVSVTSPASGGIVVIDNRGTATPTDDRLVYGPLSGFSGVDTFSYTVTDGAGFNSTARVAVNVRTILHDPIAVDDSFNLSLQALGSTTTIDVLANDFKGDNGPLRITGVTVPPTNTGSVSISTTGDSLVVTIPAGAAAVDEQFTYTVADSSVPSKTSTGTVTLHIGNTASDDVVRFIVQTFDLNGNAIDSAQVGDDFELRFFAQDIRTADDLADGRDERGVFAAFADFLFDSSLVTIKDPISYSPDFNLIHEQSILVPGIINEAGGSQDNQSVALSPQPQRVFSVRMRAIKNGTVTFKTDPADVRPAHDTLLYQTTRVVPYSQITFGTKSFSIGDPIASLFRALDDRATVANGTSTSINVLANDFLGLNSPVTISSVNSTGLIGSAVISPDGRSVTYSPNALQNATEQFSYTLLDSAGQTSSATVTVNVGNAANDDTASVRLFPVANGASCAIDPITDLPLNRISTIAKNSTFQVCAVVKDLRTPTSLPDVAPKRGISAAYLDILYEYAKASVIKLPVTTNPRGFDITFGPQYLRLLSGSANTPGLIDEVGAFQTNDTSLGSGNFELFRVTFQATGNVGDTINFVADPHDIRPDHDVLQFEPAAIVPVTQVTYIPGSVTIAASGSGEGEQRFTNLANPYDVNNDGYISPLDALIGINSLNAVGARQLVAGGGEGESSVYFVDVNHDGYHSAIDVLMVINRLNQQSSGEGEAMAIGQPASDLASGLQSTANNQVVAAAPTSPVATTSAVVPLLQTTVAAAASSAAVVAQDDDEDLLDALASDVAGAWLQNSLGN